jgi:hypothetical protein
MGYTHYAQVRRDADPELLRACAREMAKLVEATPTPLAGPYGTGTPEVDVTRGEVAFNGVGDDDCDCETFRWPPRGAGDDDPEWASHAWKTERLPYDAVLCGCLLVAQRVLGEAIRIGSDGTLGDFLDGAGTGPDSIESAAALYERVFGEAPPVPPLLAAPR